MNTLRRLRAFTLIELLIVVSILAILFGLALGGVGGCSNSEGSRVGTITKFSHKGLVYKTYEGTMLMGGTSTKYNSKGGSSIVASNWDFTVKNKSFIPQVEQAIESGHRVKLGYRQTFVAWPWNGETSYFVTDFKDLDGDEK